MTDVRYRQHERNAGSSSFNTWLVRLPVLAMAGLLVASCGTAVSSGGSFGDTATSSASPPVRPKEPGG